MSDRRWFLAAALGVLFTRLALIHYVPVACEDAYITFRYSRNLAEGMGFCFNAGERVMGFTSLPWTVWNAVGYAVMGSCDGWARGTSIACDLGTLWVIWRILPPVPARCFGFLFAFLAPFAGIAQMGIETSLFLFSIAAAAYWRRWWLVAATAVVRPEGALVAIVLSWWLSWRGRAAVALTLAAFYGACWAYFGAPLPQSVMAKAAVYGAHGPGSSRAWWEGMIPVPGRFRQPVTGEGGILSLVRVLVLPAAVAGAWRLRGPALSLALSCATVWLAYICVGSTYFAWYMFVPIAGMALSAAVGLGEMIRGRVAWAALAVVGFCLWTNGAQLYTGRHAAEHQLLMAPAVYLREHATRDQSILLEAIGLIGYETGMRMVDEIGLVSPVAITERKGGRGWYGRLVRRERPDWILMRRSQIQYGPALNGHDAPFADSLDVRCVTRGYAAEAFFGPIEKPNTTILFRRIEK